MTSAGHLPEPDSPHGRAVPGSLGPAQRTAALERLAGEELDVLVIGGGVTGAGCALDAVTRGLSVGLVEQRDLAAGTSSRSSKLIHGGLRYLEQRDIHLVREALHERGVLMTRVCPHLVRPVSFLIPLTHRIWQRAYYGAGVALYDVLAAIGADNPLPRHRHLSRQAALRLVPGLRRDHLVGGILYWDAQVDDARHTVTVARTAARHGAAIATSTRVESLVVDEGAVRGARVVDVETGRRFTVRARRVVNATGVWTDDIQDMAGRATLRVRAAKGVHLVVPRAAVDGDSGVVLRTERSVLFVIPWGKHWLVGTTDTDWAFDRAHPAASRADIDYILEHANRALARPLTHDDIVAVYAGLRPLVAAEADDTTKLSREHAVAEPVPGLVTIAGGKYTTYRLMAADTIDRVAAGLDRKVPRSCTADVPLLGAADWESWRHRAPEIAAALAIPDAIAERLLWRHGSRVVDVLALCEADPALSELLPGEGYVAAEVVHAVRHEGALHLDDVLARRLRVAIEELDGGLSIAPHVAEIMGRELGWSPGVTEREIALWRARVEAEAAAHRAPDDATAAAARAAAPDPRDLVEVATDDTAP